MHNDLAFKLKLQDSGLDNIESVYTESIKPKYINKENFTSYSYFDDKNNYFVFDNLYFSLNELRSSNLTLIIYDTKLEMNDGEESTDNKSSPSKQAKSFNFPANKNMSLKKKYNQIGYSYINFYKILSQNDNIILKQASKLFQTFSLLYTNTLQTPKDINSNSTNQILKTIQMEQNNINGDYNANNGNNLQQNNYIAKQDSLMSKEIKFQVFDDISKSFYEKIYHKGAEIGKVN